MLGHNHLVLEKFARTSGRKANVKKNFINRLIANGDSVLLTTRKFYLQLVLTVSLNGVIGVIVKTVSGQGPKLYQKNN